MPAPESPAEPDPLLVARNFVENYGKPALRRLLHLLMERISGEEIAREFGVSRERVRQWKNAFGEVKYSFRVFPEVRRLAGRPRRTGRS